MRLLYDLNCQERLSAVYLSVDVVQWKKEHHAHRLLWGYYDTQES